MNKDISKTAGEIGEKKSESAGPEALSLSSEPVFDQSHQSPGILPGEGHAGKENESKDNLANGASRQTGVDPRNVYRIVNEVVHFINQINEGHEGESSKAR